MVPVFYDGGCPLEHQEVWVQAWTSVLQRLELAGTEEQANLALMCLMFLPQALLRKPTRGSVFKSAEQESVRPLGLRNPLLKTFHRIVSMANRSVVREYVEPQQVVLSEGGAGLLVSAVRESLEVKKNNDWGCIKLHIQNAYNET